MRIINPERTGFTRVGGTLVAVGFVACSGILGIKMVMHGNQQHARQTPYAAEASPVASPEAEPTSDGEQGFGPAPTPSATPKSASSTPRASATAKASKTPKPTRTAKAPRKGNAGNAAPSADSVTLDPRTCGDWSPKNPRPLIVAGNTARVVVDTRLEDGCEPGFYTGADVHEKPTAVSKEVDLGTSFTTAGGIALNGSVLTVRDYVHGQKQSVQTPGGAVSSDIWLKVAFANGEVGNVSAVDVGFPTAAMLDRYTS